MDRDYGRHNDDGDDAGGPRSGVWLELLDRLCPIRDELGRPSDSRRYFHDDLHALADDDLELERFRALARLCLEHDRGDRFWLQQRRARIAAEQERRARQDAQQRETKSRNHQEWLRWQAEGERRAPTPITEARFGRGGRERVRPGRQIGNGASSLGAHVHIDD